jgi:hypothetical protein
VVSDPANGQVLAYESSGNQWLSQSIASGNPVLTGSGAPIAPVNTDFYILSNTAPTIGTFCLLFRGQQTAPLAFNCTAEQALSALTGLNTIGSGNMLVESSSGNDPNDGILLMFVGAFAQSSVEYPTVTNDTTDGQITIASNNVGNAGTPSDPASGALYVDDVSGSVWLLETTLTNGVVTVWEWRSTSFEGWSQDGQSDVATGGGYIAASFNTNPPTKSLRLYDDHDNGASTIQLDPSLGLQLFSNINIHLFVGIGATMQINVLPDSIMITHGSLEWNLNADGSTNLPGRVTMSGLPTFDPNVAGELWNNNGIVTVSTG